VHGNIEKPAFTDELRSLVDDVKLRNTTLLQTEQKQLNYHKMGVYGPHNKIWNVARESAIFLGGKPLLLNSLIISELIWV
jgi:hypothetical protein